jgi:hypothetical protein
MKHLFVCRGILLWISCFIFALPSPSQTLPQSDGPAVLARVELAGPVESFPLPAYAFLRDASGKDYLLVIGAESQLRQTGWPWRVLDQNAVAEQYVLAVEFRRGAREAAAMRFTPLYDDGIQWLLRATPEEVEELSQLGFELRRFSPEPIVWNRPAQITGGYRGSVQLKQSSMPDPLVSAMIGSVETTNLYRLVSGLTGEETVEAGGEPCVITSRTTTSGLPLHRAHLRVFQRFQELGLDVRFAGWTNSYVNSNVVATLPGGARSNELVLITAHMDNLPYGDRAYGADDNCSGSVAVLTAASIMSQYRFDRSVRFVLFTGEEQGLLGSAVYAASARAAGDNIIGVLNMDMLAYDSSSPDTFKLFTRYNSDPLYTNDLLIAATFTNAVTAYGLTNHLAPVIVEDSSFWYSDHSSFWNNSYGAILAIEDYPNDYSQIHTLNDRLSYFNLAYYTASVRACIATVAHLAGPVSRVPAGDVIELVSSDWTPGSGIGAGVFLARHLPGATESGSDSFDLALTNAPSNPDTNWLKLTTAPYGPALVTDSRPTNSETLFTASLTAVSTNGGNVTCSNRLRFDFVTPPAPNRIYIARIQVNGPFTQPTNFLCVTNLRNVVTQGGYVDLPRLTNAPAGTVYGACDIAARFLDTSRASCHLRFLSNAPPTLTLGTDGQIGVRLIDDLESCTNLANAGWVRLGSFTNDVLPDADSFDSGWKPLTRTADTTSLPPAPEHYFRLKRTWLAP